MVCYWAAMGKSPENTQVFTWDVQKQILCNIRAVYFCQYVQTFLQLSPGIEQKGSFMHFFGNFTSSTLRFMCLKGVCTRTGTVETQYHQYLS